MVDDILFVQQGAWGVITLNRPNALNALTNAMCKELDDALLRWAADETIRAVMIRGAGEKAFCAGGDIRWLYETAGEDPVRAAEFFRTEYTMNARIHDFPKPYVALMDGVVMGGGVGVSASASHRIVGERTMWAMPETGIGLFPDVGGTWFLSRLQGGLGHYVAQTGVRLSAADLIYAGLADVHVGEARVEDIDQALFSLEQPDHQTITDALAPFSASEESALAGDRAEIDTFFADIPSIEGLLDALENQSSPFAEKTLKTLSRMSPTSMKITLSGIRRSANLTFHEALQMEFAIASEIMKGHDFREGVRALIVDKDRNPRWDPAHAEDVLEPDIDSWIKILGAKGLDLD